MICLQMLQKCNVTRLAVILLLITVHNYYIKAPSVTCLKGDDAKSKYTKILFRYHILKVRKQTMAQLFYLKTGFQTMISVI